MDESKLKAIADELIQKVRELEKMLENQQKAMDRIMELLEADHDKELLEEIRNISEGRESQDVEALKENEIEESRSILSNEALLKVKGEASKLEKVLGEKGYDPNSIRRVMDLNKELTVLKLAKNEVLTEAWIKESDLSESKIEKHRAISKKVCLDQCAQLYRSEREAIIKEADKSVGFLVNLELNLKDSVNKLKENMIDINREHGVGEISKSDLEEAIEERETPEKVTKSDLKLIAARRDLLMGRNLQPLQIKDEVIDARRDLIDGRRKLAKIEKKLAKIKKDPDKAKADINKLEQSYLRAEYELAKDECDMWKLRGEEFLERRDMYLDDLRDTEQAERRIFESKEVDYESLREYEKEHGEKRDKHREKHDKRDKRDKNREREEER